MLKKPQNVYMPIDKFQAKIFKHKDAEKRGEWVANFALALSEEAEDDFAKLLLDHAQLAWYKDTVKAWRSKAKKALSQCGKEPTAKQIHAWCYEEFGDEYIEAIELLSKNKEKLRKKTQEFIDEINDILPATGNDQVPAGDATRSDAVESSPSASDGVVLGSTTVSGKNYAEEGANGNAALNVTTVRKNGALESGTSSANLQGSARPQKTGAGASIAPLLISPLENRAPSPTIAQKSDKKKQPVNIGAAAPVPPLGSLDCHNREPQAPSPVASSITGDVLGLAYSGEFGNVRLTQEQYAELGIKFGNQQKLNRAIDSLSCKIENGETKPRNHYAELVKWANYRDDMDEKEELKKSSSTHYETVSEHNRRVLENGRKWIDEHFPKKESANGL